MKLLAPRLMYFYAFISIIAMFFVALYLEYFKGVTPCPLCLLQRVMLAALGIVFFIGFACKTKRLRGVILGSFSLLFSVCGALLAGRQTWIQYSPTNQNGDCGVSLQYMLQVLPLDQVIKKIFQGTAECSTVNWSLFGLSMAEWSLIIFIVFALFSLWQLNKKIIE